MSDTHARRKPSRRVYIRRRIAVLIGLLALILAVVLVIVGPQSIAGWLSGSGSDDPAPAQAANGESDDATPGSDSASSQATKQSEPEEDEEPSACEPRDLLVEAIVDAQSYAAGEKPQLSLKVTNQRDVACDADLGTETMVFEVHSGSELYWSSKDCQIDAQSNTVRLGAGETLESESISWDRTRSSVETCDSERAPVPAGGASYHLSVEVGGATSPQSAQFMLH